MNQEPGIDVFISHHAADAEAVRAFAVALQVHSISAQLDPLQGDAEDARRRMRSALGRCKAFLAWNTSHHAQERALQREFMSVFAATAQRDDQRQRLIVIDASAEAPPLAPDAALTRYRIDAAHSPVTPTEDALAGRVATHLRTLEGTLVPDVIDPPAWLPFAMSGFERFAGRTEQLWQLHRSFAENSGSGRGATVQLIGTSGAGKSVLAEEYAVRFAPRYPGGIFWLDAGALPTVSSAELQIAREHAWCEMAAALHLPLADHGFQEITELLRARLQERGLPFLWIVDHLPAGLTVEAVGAWRAPHELGDSLLVCRSDEYARLGAQIRIESVAADDARPRLGKLSAPARRCLRLAAVLAHVPIPTALLTTAVAQQSHRDAPLSSADAAIDELIEAALATRINHQYVGVSPRVRRAVLEHESDADLDAARALAATTLASELTQAPEASYSNPYLRWIPHAFQIAETAAASNQVVEIAAWLARFETIAQLRTINRRALACLRDGDVERAQQLLDLEFTATRRGLGEQHPGTITSVNNLGAILGLRGDLSTARSLFEHALEVRGKTLGEEHPDTLTPLNNLAAILWSEADFEGAQALFECVVEHRTRWLGEKHLETLVAMKNLAVTLRQQGNHAGARRLLERVVQWRQEALGPHHRDTRAAMASLARTLNEESNQLLTRATDKTTPDTPLHLGTERSLASVYLG